MPAANIASRRVAEVRDVPDARLELLRSEAEDVYLCFNTKQEDQGVVNAARLKELLGMT